LRDLLAAQLADLEIQASRITDLRQRVRGLLNQLDSSVVVEPEQFLSTLEPLILLHTSASLSSQQHEALTKRTADLGGDMVEALKSEWLGLLDPHKVPTQGPVAEQFAEITSIMNGPHPQPLNPMTAFDAVVFIDTVTPWHTFIDLSPTATKRHQLKERSTSWLHPGRTQRAKRHPCQHKTGNGSCGDCCRVCPNRTGRRDRHGRGAGYSGVLPAAHTASRPARYLDRAGNVQKLLHTNKVGVVHHDRHRAARTGLL
jgi:hypothetical protein